MLDKTEIEKYLFMTSHFYSELSKKDKIIFNNKYFNLVAKLTENYNKEERFSRIMELLSTIDDEDKMIKLNIKDIPKFLRKSEIFADFFSEDDDEDTFVPLNVIVANDTVNSIEDYIKLYNVCNYWGINFTESMKIYGLTDKKNVLEFLYANASNTSSRSLIKELLKESHKDQNIIDYLYTDPLLLDNIRACSEIKKLEDKIMTKEIFLKKLNDILKSTFNYFTNLNEFNLQHFNNTEGKIFIETHREPFYQYEFATLINLLNSEEFNIKLMNNNKFFISALCCNWDSNNIIIIKLNDLLNTAFIDIDENDLNDPDILMDIFGDIRGDFLRETENSGNFDNVY